MGCLELRRVNLVTHIMFMATEMSVQEVCFMRLCNILRLGNFNIKSTLLGILSRRFQIKQSCTHLLMKKTFSMSSKLLVLLCAVFFQSVIERCEGKT